MRKPVVTMLAFLFAAAILSAQTARAPAPGEYGRAPKLETQPFQGPNNRTRFEYPKKDWQAVPGGSSVLVSLAQKKGEAAVVVEETRLNQALAAEDITDLFGQLEADVVKEHQPSATDVQSKVVDAGGRRFVILSYGRKGIAGPERVRQYSFPVGAELFRLTCSAPVPLFARYEPVFAHIAATFTFTAGATK
ncbi:MAG: hypothetical protein ACHQO8_07495 [Vicinamibacterales bacterium]